MSCDCINFERFLKFDGWDEFENLSKVIEEKIARLQFEEVHVVKKYSGLQMIEEREFLCTDCGMRWHLIKPEFPFPGGFMSVDDWEKYEKGLIKYEKPRPQFPALEKLLKDDPKRG